MRADPDEDLLRPVGRVCAGARLLEGLDDAHRQKIAAALDRPQREVPRANVAKYAIRKAKERDMPPVDPDTLRKHWRGACGCGRR